MKKASWVEHSPVLNVGMMLPPIGSALAVCEERLCHHETVHNVDGYGDAVLVPACGPRMVCTSCGIIGAHARPNWEERAPSESLTGRQWF